MTVLALSAALAALVAHDPVSDDPAECGFAAQRFDGFITQTPPGEVRNAVGSDWLVLDYTAEEVAELIAQADRERGPDAPFAMGYRPDFARAVAALTEDEAARFHQHLTMPAPIACPGLETGAPPFTDDLRGFLDWAEDQMVNPDPGAPDGAQTLAMSRPVIFDDGHRALYAESYTYTPIPLSRPPSATLAFVVYVREDEDWTHEASMILARGG